MCNNGTCSTGTSSRAACWMFCGGKQNVHDYLEDYECPPSSCTAPTAGPFAVSPGQATFPLSSPSGIVSFSYTSTNIKSLTCGGCSGSPGMTTCAGSPHTVKCTAVQQDPKQQSSFEIHACSCDNSCSNVDPAATRLQLNTGTSVTQTFTGIGSNEGQVTVSNAPFGLTRLVIAVNGRKHAVLPLSPAQTKIVNLTPVLMAAENTIAFTGYGKPGASAEIVMTPVTSGRSPAPLMENDVRSSLMEAPVSRLSFVWGRHLPQVVEQTSNEQTAIALSDTIHLTFATTLDPRTVADPSRFGVDVNGQNVAVQASWFEGRVNGADVVTLQLRQGSLSADDQVLVFWDGLHDVEGEPLSGRTGPIQVQ